MGGKLVQYLALAARERIRGLVLVASPSAGRLPIPAAARGWADLAGDGPGLLEATVRPFLRRPVPEAVLGRFARDAARIPRSYLEGTMALLSETSFADRLGAPEIPVLVASSAADALHPTARDLPASFPTARLEVFDAGSEIPMEQPAALARAIDRFLSDI
jgi:pimeloyl-ACP methyl ester carboxylesterase